MEPFPLSVVIITRNRSALVPDCLRHVLAQDYAALQVIVVDASDGDETSDIVKTFPEVLYVRLSAAAHQMPRSRNAGIQASRGDIIAFIDDDSLAQPGWARNLAANYASPQVGGVGGLVLAPGESARMTGTRPAVTSTGSVRGDFNVFTAGPIEVAHLMGCNMSFRREALMAVGGFDPLFDGSNFREETDVCIGVTRSGFKLIYDPKVAVTHLYAAKDGFGRDALTDSNYRFSVAKNMTYFRLKHFLSAPTLLALFVGGPLLTLVNEIRRRGVRGILASWIDWSGRAAGAWTYLNDGR